MTAIVQRARERAARAKRLSGQVKLDKLARNTAAFRAAATVAIATRRRARQLLPGRPGEAGGSR